MIHKMMKCYGIFFFFFLSFFIFYFIYFSFACAIIPQPSTLFLLLAFAFISSLGLTQIWLFPCIPHSSATLLFLVSSHLFSFIFSLIFSSFTLILPSTYLSHFWILTSLFMFHSTHMCFGHLIFPSFPFFLSDVLWSVLFYLIITFSEIPLVNFPLFPFLSAFSHCLSTVFLFLGTILFI